MICFQKPRSLGSQFTLVPKPTPTHQGKPVSSCLSLEGRHRALPPGLRDQGLAAPHLSLGREPTVTQGGLSASQAPRHILTPAVQEGEAFGEPCKGHAACCPDRETESQSKKRASPGHAAGARSPGVPGNPRCSLSGPPGGRGRLAASQGWITGGRKADRVTGLPDSNARSPILCPEGPTCSWESSQRSVPPIGSEKHTELTVLRVSDA